jgi:hypothetical protein
MPFFALDLWSRWMFMLVYPFTFFAANGLFKVLRGSNGQGRRFGGFSKKAVFGGLGVVVLLGCVYMATPLLMNTVKVGVFYLPYVSAHFCSAPAVPYEDVESVTMALTWLNENMDGNSCAVVNHVFSLWDLVYLDKSHVTIEFWNDASLALDNAVSLGYRHAYFVWWNTDIGWYNVSVPTEFMRMTDFGRISIYEFECT